ncbi:hypothetical protein [Methyloceanibacter methanicus]|nr:hypothetical protein [Methyloceanibacter methanicus]
MRFFDRTFLLPFLLTLVICLAVAALGLDAIKEWQTLIAGILALVGATLVLLAADRQIANEQSLANDDREVAKKAAKMRLAYEMEYLAQQFARIVNSDLGFPLQSVPLPPFPVPSFANQPGDLVALSAEESEELYTLAREIRIDAGQIEWLSALPAKEAAHELKVSCSGGHALDCVKWRDALGQAIGWSPMVFPPAQRQSMEQAASAQGTSSGSSTST